MNKVIMTTSDNYHHLLLISTYLFNRNWDKNQEVELVGYKKPEMELPSNFKFISLGEQVGGKTNFSTDLRKYFETIKNEWFIWMMEDTFILEVNKKQLENAWLLTKFHKAGRINLSDECVRQDHVKTGIQIENIDVYKNTQTARYRLSTQISIWNKQFLLTYLTPCLSPWDFESQDPTNDGWQILGFDKKNMPVKHNEGVTKRDIFKYNFVGLEKEVEEMKKLNIIK